MRYTPGCTNTTQRSLVDVHVEATTPGVVVVYLVTRSHFPCRFILAFRHKYTTKVCVPKRYVSSARDDTFWSPRNISGVQ